MKKFIIIFFIGILFFSQNGKVFALTEAEHLAEGQRVVAEMEKDQENEKGIYFFDAVLKKIVKFFNYNDEFDSTSNPKITEDLRIAVYSIGDGIFMKDFNELDLKNNENLGVGDFGEINVNENTVKLFKTEVQGETLVLSWKDEGKFDGYLIQIKDSVDGFLDGDSKNLVYLLKKDVKNGEKIFSDIKKDFLNGENFFLTEEDFSSPELKIFLNENFFYAKIFGITSGENSGFGKISTGSAQKILYGNAENLPPEKIGKIEKINFPILVENYLKVSDLFFTEKQIGDTFSWDFDGDEVFERSGDEIFLPIQKDLGNFFVNLKIIKKTGEQFIKKIQLNFFSPKIFFDKDENGKIFGHIEPRINNFPVSYTYENEEVNKKFGLEKIFTDEEGEFNFLKKSEKESRVIYLENKEVLGEIFLETGNVELKFSDYYGDFLVISENIEGGKKVIAIIYLSRKDGNFEIYDKNYQIIRGEKGKDFYLKKFGKKDFYFNFGVKI